MSNAPAGKNLKITAAERPNTLGLSQRDLVALLEKLEAADKGKPPVRRGFARWPFRHATVRCTLIQPSGAEVTLRLACRNLSRGGVSLLHNAFVHPGSQIIVSLPRLVSGTKDLPGIVTRCQHRKAVLHEIGVKFDEEIDLREYLGGGNGAEFFSLENVDPEKLVGNLLYIEDCDVDARILQHFLRDTGLSITRAENGTEGRTKASETTYSMIICDWRLPDTDGVKLMQSFRDSGITCPGIIVTADPMGLMRSGAYDVPNTGILTKPLTQPGLVRAIAERLLIGKDAGHDENVVTGDAALGHAMGGQLGKLGETLESALNAKTVRNVVESCLQLRGSAPTLGMPQIAHLADAALNAMGDGLDLAKGEKLLREVVAACKRAA